MALTFGFYNSVEGDRVYDAVQFGQIFDGIITDGIYATYKQAMVVKASENAGEVIIQPGRAWFNHTWSYNDADLVMTAPAPEVLLDRIDALVLDINEEQNVRTNSFVWVQGTPASVNPERPTLTHTTTHNQYPLCYIRRHAETTTIYTEDITNMVGTSECPFVTGVLEGVDVDIWLAQWDAEFHTWENVKQTAFEAWFQNIRDQLDTDAAGHLQNEIDDIVSELTANNNRIYMDYQGGKYGINTSPSRGADTFVPFRRPNTMSYSFPAGGGETVDLGEDNEVRYVNATNCYNQGVINADARANPASVNYQTGYNQGVADVRATYLGTVGAAGGTFSVPYGTVAGQIIVNVLALQLRVMGTGNWNYSAEGTWTNSPINVTVNGTVATVTFNELYGHATREGTEQEYNAQGKGWADIISATVWLIH